MIRHTVLALATLGLAATALPAAAQPQPALSLSNIMHNGPLQLGTNTVRVTVNNTSSTGPIRPREEVIVKLVVLDPSHKRAEYTVRITSGIGTRGSRVAVFPNVGFHVPGAHTVTASATTNFVPGRRNAVAPDKTEVFNVGGPRADASNQLTVLVRNEKTNAPVNGVRVSLKADNRELDWKQTSGSGEAKFLKVAASPDGKPYIVEVRFANKVLGTFDYKMPDQASTFEVKVIR